MLWTYQQIDKAPADFGVPSIHGLLMSILLSCATFSFYLFKVTRQGKYLGVPVFAALWSIVIISRDYLLGTLLQILFLQLSLIKPTKRQITLMLAGSVIVTVLFGEIGNFRSGGADLIVALGRPTDVFPRWLPASFLWAYLYLTTPLNNLFNTIDVRGQPETISILATTAQLFPTVVRRLIFPASFLEGELVDSNFTVSTAFVDPFKDMGMAGIALFSAFAGAVAAVFWLRRSRPFFLLGYAFVALTLFFSVFYNHLLYLPYLVQLVWFYVLLGGRLHAQLAK